MKILICGGYGFIGRNLIEKLQLKNFEIITLSQRKHKLINGVTEIVYKNIKQIEIDEIIEDIKPDCTIFLATKYDQGDLDSIVDVNIKLPAMLIKAMCTLPIDKRNIILTDSYWSFGDEDSKNIPLDDYAAGKSAIKEFAKTYNHYKNISVINLAVYGTYGRGDARGKLIDIIINSIKYNIELELTAGEQLLDLVHVDDICSGYIRAINIIKDERLNNRTSFCNYALSSGKVVKVKDLIAELAKKHDVSCLKVGVLQYRERELFQPQYPYPNLPGWVAKNDVVMYIENSLIHAE